MGGRSRRQARQAFCRCGSGRPFSSCHQPAAMSGPGAALLLAEHPFPWSIRPAPTSPRRDPPAGVHLPDYALSGVPESMPVGDIRSADEIRRMRSAGRHAAELLVFLAGPVRPGVTTDELDAAAYEEEDSAEVLTANELAPVR